MLGAPQVGHGREVPWGSRGRRFKSCRPDTANKGGTRSSGAALAALTSGNSGKLGRRAVAEIKYKISVVERLGAYLGPGEARPIAHCVHLRGERHARSRRWAP